MATDCIMCGDPAGSREHVFPAAFGGRRMNRGIYCEIHNNELGHHVVELLKALSYFNASLGVRSDHHHEPKPHLIEAPHGQRYQVLHDHIEVAPPPPLSHTPELLGKETTLSFATTSQRDRWITQQKKKGFEFLSAVTGESRTEYFTTPISQHFEFGSEPFRCAVAYVALTHLAHYFPDIVHEEALSSIRKCVLGEEVVGDRVWWVDPARVSIPSKSSFNNVHSAVIAISGETGRVTALIAFFNHLCLAVDLGIVDARSSQRVTTLIDPLAERPGQDKDIVVIRDGLPLQLPTAEEGKTYIRRVVEQKQANPVVEILNAHHKEHLRAFVQKLLPQLKSTHEKTKAERLDIVQKLIDEQGQRILNLLTKGIGMVLEQPPALPSPILEVLKNAIVEDSTTAHGIAEKSMGYLKLAKAAFTAELIRLLDADSLDNEALTLLFADGPGIATALKPVMHAVIRSTNLRPRSF